MPEGQGVLPLCTETMTSLGGRVLALLTWSAEEPDYRMVTVKVTGVGREKLTEGIGKLGVEILDVRES
ncbi:MAG TPA: hypothetical protein VMW58_13920, partial [Anaerolineae bacterium]|nr:hypothetical protein [Anaerolineae bacterium]